MHELERVIAARWILPVSSEPIQGGWIRLQGKQVVEIGTGPTPREAWDLGDAAGDFPLLVPVVHEELASILAVTIGAANS